MKWIHSQEKSERMLKMSISEILEEFRKTVDSSYISLMPDDYREKTLSQAKQQLRDYLLSILPKEKDVGMLYTECSLCGNWHIRYEHGWNDYRKALLENLKDDV